MVSINIQRQILEKQPDTEKTAKYMQMHLIQLFKASEKRESCITTCLLW